MVRWLVGVALLWGCSSDPALELAVDLRSDYAPLADIDRVEVFLELGEGLERREEASLNGGENLLSGFRVAEYTDLPRGQFGLRLLAYRGGTTLVTRRANVDLRDSLAMTVVVSRSCEGVSCPQSGDPEIATECIGGTCEPPECFPESPSSCLGSCTIDADCPSLGCGTGRCIDTACFLEVDNSACASGECRADLTCAPQPDVGMPDVGMPDAFDAGPPDVGFDSGPPPPDCPTYARDCPSDFVDWNRTNSWSCRADEKLGRARHTLTCRVCNGGGCRDCDYPNILVECRCREPEMCSSGRCTSGVSSSRSRCSDTAHPDPDLENFRCDEITDRDCD